MTIALCIIGYTFILLPFLAFRGGRLIAHQDMERW
jgi:hypothetical protein